VILWLVILGLPCFVMILEFSSRLAGETVFMVCGRLDFGI
jgi:hypothetical protein